MHGIETNALAQLRYFLITEGAKYLMHTGAPGSANGAPGSANGAPGSANGAPASSRHSAAGAPASSRHSSEMAELTFALQCAHLMPDYFHEMVSQLLSQLCNNYTSFFVAPELCQAILSFKQNTGIDILDEEAIALMENALSQLTPTKDHLYRTPAHANSSVGEFLPREPNTDEYSIVFNSLLAAEFRSFAGLISERFPQKGFQFLKRYDLLKRAINKWLWRPELALYRSRYDPNELRFWTGRMVAGLFPAFLRLSERELTAECIEMNLLDERRFFRTYGITERCIALPAARSRAVGDNQLIANQTISNETSATSRIDHSSPNEPLIIAASNRSLIIPNVLAVRTLLREGYSARAFQLSRRVLSALYENWRDSGTLSTAYDAETGAPIGAHTGDRSQLGCNLMALELIEVVSEGV